MMKLGCGMFDYSVFLLNVEKPSEEFVDHISGCEECKSDFVEIRVASKKMELCEFEPTICGLKYGKILLKLKEGMLEIIDAISGTRYGAKLAFRGDAVYQTRKEIIYESGGMKIFVDSYEANELILSVRVNDYGEITISDENNNILRATSGKGGTDLRIKPGKYTVRHGDEEILIQVERED
ncbi:MAG: hypothetical protein ABDH28_07165 [Brevinematia bacterium]